MTIPEELIMRHLDMLLTSSDPGDSMHHLHVITAPPGAIGPLGLPDEKKLETTVYALAPTSPDVQNFTADVIATAAMEARAADNLILFAALSQEVWTVKLDKGDAASLELSRRLQRESRLHEHPAAVEVTIVYAASRDGRRWRGRRWLTGPNAGTTQDAELLVGPPHPNEGNGVACAPLVRRLVGL